MRNYKRIFVAVSTMVIALNMLPASGSSPGTSQAVFGATAMGATGDNPCYDFRPKERGFKRKINNSRNNAGLGGLKLDPELSKAARKHTYEMVNKQILEHTTSTQLRNRVTNWSLLGENVGVGATVDSLHNAFMNSPAHRANIMLSGFRNVGVGTASKGGRLWVTVIFESVSNPGTTLRMPNC